VSLATVSINVPKAEFWLQEAHQKKIFYLDLMISGGIPIAENEDYFQRLDVCWITV
jgi:hypothetical protein